LRSQQGCEASFAVLVDRFAQRLLRFLNHRTASVHDAEDLVQDTFVKAYENIHRFRNSAKFSTWLFTIAARLAVSHHRRLHHSQAASDVEACSYEPKDVLAEQEARQRLWAAAGNLSENQYRALRLKYAEDMSVKEIAQVLRKSQVSVKVLLYRARLNLAERLRKEAAEAEIANGTSAEQTLYVTEVEGA
jgi:RNA polymerase sigma-70 factor (ECF subfamily)